MTYAASPELGEVERAALAIHLYEQMLAGTGRAPGAYFDRLVPIVESEPNPLVVDLLLEQIPQIFWNLRPLASRERDATLLERSTWDTMLAQTEASRRKVWFEAFVDIALTDGALGRAFRVWIGEQAVDDLPLSENDRIDILQALAVRLPGRVEEMLALQTARTKNPDNLRKLEFIAPSLSADEAVRDAFFASLADEENRRTEPWVLDALRNLHHPVRIAGSEKYLLPSLELLAEIQATGDIFFPTRWLDATLSHQRSSSAVATVRRFLDERPDYNRQLTMTILQSSHMLFRAHVLTRDAAARQRSPA